MSSLFFMFFTPGDNNDTGDLEDAVFISNPWMTFILILATIVWKLIYLKNKKISA
jgi:hypothetical protein